jgi:hypothetical protein
MDDDIFKQKERAGLTSASTTKQSAMSDNGSEDWVTIQQLASEWHATDGTVSSFLYSEKARLKDYRKRHGPRHGYVYFREAVERLRTLKCRGPAREAAWLEIKPPKPDTR